ncbi:MAG: choice-of-anchor J domain-containing protein [Bacteroidales bacterium]|nr:choice-of-anchor J domain-containing protein [Bacteroidales bacterium]
MRKFYKSLIAISLVGTILIGGAENLVKISPIALPQAESVEQASMTKKQSATATNSSQALTPKTLKSLRSAADATQLQLYVETTSQHPTAQNPVMRSPFGPEDDTEWIYTGFNAYAGLEEDLTTVTGGFVNFNLEPFACDTVSSHSGASPYSFLVKDKLHSYLPNSSYTQMTRTIYDANTLEPLDQKTVDIPGGSTAYIPYLASYDEYRDVVWAISLENGYHDSYAYTAYYLNIVDLDECRLKRVGYLGSWETTRGVGNFNPKGFTANGNVIYIQNSDDKVYIETLNPYTLEITRVGYTEIPTEYLYGVQPMIYDANQGHLLINHYDLGVGTQYYEVWPFVIYGSAEDVCTTKLIENAPTGFTFFYERPEATTSFLRDLDPIEDLVVECSKGSNDVKVSCTIPSTADGEAIEIPSWTSNQVKLYIYVDGGVADEVDGLPDKICMGDKVEFTIPNVDNGMHIITVQPWPYYNELNGNLRYSGIALCGYDKPDNVGDPTLAISDGRATISWSAPTQGRYADFGDFFDPSGMTYTVVRDLDNKVVAEEISATTCTDTDLLEEVVSYTYTIYANAKGGQSTGIQTNVVSYGSYLVLPYVNTFDSNTDIYGWEILNVNDDGDYLTWRYNTYYHHMESSGQSGCDDWLISPPFLLDNSKLYVVSYQLSAGYDDEDPASLCVTLGNGQAPDDQTDILADYENVYVYPAEVRRQFVNPEVTGSYNLGFYNYGTNYSYVSIDSLVVKEIATSEAPSMVRGLTITPDDKGALGATLTFTLPTVDIAGNSLSSLNKVMVYDLDGNLLGSKSGIRPGNEVSIHVKASKGYNTYSVVAANDYGEGWPVDITRFIGPDSPKAASNFKATWGDEKNIVVLSWDLSSEGVNGGYADPDAFTYNVFRYDSSEYTYVKLGETVGEQEVEVTIADFDDLGITQDQFVFGLTVSNDEGESDYVKAGIVLGTPYEMPYEEPFGNLLYHSPYITQSGLNSQAWDIDCGYYNDKIQPQTSVASLVAVNPGSAEGDSYFWFPIIDFTSASHPLITLWLHHSESMPEGTLFQVKASIDGANTIDVSDAVELIGNNGWQQHVFDLSPLCGKIAQIVLYAYTPSPSARVFADNFTISEASGNDLAITAISQPYNPTAGDQATITVTVANLGAVETKDFSVLFNVDDNTVAEEYPTSALASGQSTQFEFPLSLYSYYESILYSAELLYSDDNEDNNLSSEVEIDIEHPDLPAPTDLTLVDEETNLMKWTAPEIAETREVTLDFEDVPAFQTDNIHGWTTADMDGHLTLTFVQYYDNYWPYAGQPLAWMTWSAREAGCPSASAWFPYAGEKCLIHFGNYGEDVDGRTNSEADDDWFISPEVTPGSTFSFVALANEAGSAIEVVTSSTGRNPEDFTTVVLTKEFAEATTWYAIDCQLPDEAKYVAIHTLLDGFGILIDDITYTTAVMPQLLGYNVYCADLIEQTVDSESARGWTASQYSVSAVYDEGESLRSDPITTVGIELVEWLLPGVAVTTGPGTITVSGCAGRQVMLVNIAGMVLANSPVEDAATWNVTPGVYILNVGGVSFKVCVQ